MGFRIEILPFLGMAVVVGVLLTLLLGAGMGMQWSRAIAVGLLVSAVPEAYFFWFFRNPDRTPPSDPDMIVAAADGVIAKIATFEPAEFSSISMLAGLKPEDMDAFADRDVLRISIFLSLFDVHVNRSPIHGVSRFLGYFPGKHLFTFDEKSSDVNQHNSILIQNERTSCLVNQIVGPVCRRVVYWLDHNGPVDVAMGDDFGMMKFGSRLDMYFPAEDIEVLVSEGDRARAGESVIGKYRQTAEGDIL
jgi:phosphatidylserine decarboxylase